MLTRLGMVLAVLCMLSGAVLGQDAAKLSDRQITHVVYAARQIEIEAAELALSKSTNNDVRAFAAAVVRDDTEANKHALDLTRKLKFTPEDNDLSRSLTGKAADIRAELTQLNGAEFDKAYMANETAYHVFLNGALEITLIPSATNTELKDALHTGLEDLRRHQKHAQEIISGLK